MTDDMQWRFGNVEDRKRKIHRTRSISCEQKMAPVVIHCVNVCVLFNCACCLMICINSCHWENISGPISFFGVFVIRFVDESPRWLFSQGRYQESGAIIRKMLIQNGKADAIPEQGFTLDQLQQALSTTKTSDNDKEPTKRSPSNQLTSSNPGSVQEDGNEVSSSDRKYGIVDLFKTPRLRSRTLNISLNW